MTLEEKLIYFKEKGFTCDPILGKVFTHKNILVCGKTRGYIRVNTNVNNKNIGVYAHQLIWFFYYNECPSDHIDHIDKNKLNNNINNLRLITHQKNAFNTNAKGYCWDKFTQNYQAYINLNNKHINLGRFNTPEEAHQAYLDAKKIYHII